MRSGGSITDRKKGKPKSSGKTPMMGGFRWWREAEEDLGEEVVVVRQGHRRRR
jgi:hypothetical protein